MQASAPSSSTLPVAPYFSQHNNCLKGLESEANKTGHCQVHVGEMETEQMSASRGAGGGGECRESEMELPKEGLSAPTLHLPTSLEFKESFHLSASGTWNRFAAKQGWAKSGFPDPSLLWDPELPWADYQGKLDKSRNPHPTPPTSLSQGTMGSHCLDHL